MLWEMEKKAKRHSLPRSVAPSGKAWWMEHHDLVFALLPQDLEQLAAIPVGEMSSQLSQNS